MAEQEPINTVAYVHTDAGLVSTDELSAEQRKKLATELKLEYLNNLFSGEAAFTAAEEDAEG